MLVSQVLERRRYRRYGNAICKVVMSEDNKNWQEIDVIDISAGGIKFTCAEDLEDRKSYYFDIAIYNMLSEFNMKFEGVIVRREESGIGKIYAVKYINVNRHNQIQLDEVMESRITLSKQMQHAPNHEEGVYTFFLIPRTKTRRRMTIY